MDGSTLIKAVEQRVEAMISEDPALFLVEVRIKPTNNIKVFIDGDNGISIEKLVQYNRRLYRKIEEESLVPGGDISLEVSSPGLDEPLKLKRQFQMTIGRFVEVMDNEGAKKEGKLVELTDEGLVIESVTGKGKKLETVQSTISFDNIKTTKVQIKF
jgi:ribosome maturation factor RimP